MQGTEDTDRKIAKDFESFAMKSEIGARTDLQELVQQWGPNAKTDSAKLWSSWEHAKAKSTPLWLAALSRSKLLASDLVDMGADLSSPNPESPLMQAWRYAAFNGWAKEASILFEAQALAQGSVAGGWSELWSAVEEGCRAQEAGWGQKAASWIGELIGGSIGAKEKILFGMLGKAFDQSAPAQVSGVGPAKAGGWEPLCKAARWLWGPCKPAYCESAIKGHGEAKSLALEMCDPDTAWAQSLLIDMLKEQNSMEAETLLSLESLLGAAAGGQKAPAQGAPGWAGAKKKAKQWAASASRLVSMGAVWPKGVLSSACAKGDWSKAYALALAGYPLDQGAEPALWALAKSRRSDAVHSAIAQLAHGSGAGFVDEQALDMAKALGQAGAKAGEAGPDGLDAVARLEAEEDTAKWSRELLDALSASQSASAKPPLTTRERLEQRGLLPLLDYLMALREKEQIAQAAGIGDIASSGSTRL